MYDQTGDFNNSFYLGAAIGFLGGCLSLIVVIRIGCRKEYPETVHEAPQKHCEQRDNKEQTVATDDAGLQTLCASE